MQNIYKLKGVVQNYSWGGTGFIPDLIGAENPEQKPFAEYWLGAHPNASALMEDENISLLEFIQQHPVEVLGSYVFNEFGSLPYLFKILDVRQMLSIQVHPSKSAAEEEYEKEEKRGIPATASHRNYKDKNHKPELMVALNDFWLLHGFKNKNDIEAILKSIEELNFLLPAFQLKGYKGLYEEVMTMPQEEVDAALTPLLQKIIPAYDAGTLSKSEEHFWAARAAKTFCKNNCYDRGIFSIYLFNLLHLKQGEAIYQPAGLPHAYLEGQNVEVMANSDNVLRAGLTDKHIDVSELLKHVTFEATLPAIIKGSNNTEQTFNAPVKEFLLKRTTIEFPCTTTPEQTSIFFFYEGSAIVSSGGKQISFRKGEAVLAIGGKELLITPNDPVIIYSVATPNKN